MIHEKLDVVEQIEKLFLTRRKFDTENVNSTIYPVCVCVMIYCIAAAGRTNVQV